MEAMQLELNLEELSEKDHKISLLVKEMNDMKESVRKVRKKLFCDMGELKKEFFQLKLENEYLKQNLRELRNEKTDWIYAQGNHLFDVQEYPKTASGCR